MITIPGFTRSSDTRTAGSAGLSPLRVHDVSVSPLTVSRRTYWLLAGAIVATYLLLWLSSFRYVYGWIVDDRPWYEKGVAVVQDWKNAFRVDYDAYHAHPLAISYLSLKSGISLPSYPLPGLQERTGQFRFLLLYTLILHALLLIVWAWFATGLTDNRLVALLSLALLATSPTLMLWSPQPESRVLGLPFILAGLCLLLRQHPSVPRAGWRRTAMFLVAGSLFGFAQSIHYTSLYLILPVCVVYWGLRLRSCGRRGAYWLGLLSFSFGCVWWQGLMELLSYFVVGIPWQQGPTMTLLQLRADHTSPGSRMNNVMAYGANFLSQMGVPLLVATALGWLGYLRSAGSTRRPGAFTRLVVGLSIPLGLVYLGLSGSLPFFRQTSVLQPFMFLFASLAIVGVACRLVRPRPLQSAMTVALLGVVGLIPWMQARAVFEAHQGLGRALEWAYANRGDRGLEWLPMHVWVNDPGTVTGREELEHAPPDDWLITNSPKGFVTAHPSLRPYIEDVQPLASWPTLGAADAPRAERSTPDLLTNETRIISLSALQEAMQGQSVRVESVMADSVSDPSAEPANVFDRDASPDRATAWISADTPMPHALELRFAEAIVLGEVRVVSPPPVLLPSPSRPRAQISVLEVQAADERGAYRTVWAGRSLEREPVVAAHWDPAPTTGLKLLVHRQTLPWAETDRATIEEIVLPGFQVVAPRPERALPELVLGELRPTAAGIVASGRNLTPATVVVLDGTRLPSGPTPGGKSGELLARIPAPLLEPSGQREVYLSDGLRRSATRLIAFEAPVLREIHPASTAVGTTFNVQPDGQSALWVECDHAVPGTLIHFDGRPLATAFGDEHGLSASVPDELIAEPGRHMLWLEGLFGRSNSLEFMVTEAAPGAVRPSLPTELSPTAEPGPSRDPGPPVLRQLLPASSRPGQGFNVQGDGQSALAAEAENALPGTVIVFAGRPLKTTRGSDRLLTAVVPAELYSRPGRYEIYLERDGTASNRLAFIVEP